MTTDTAQPNGSMQQDLPLELSACVSEQPPMGQDSEEQRISALEASISKNKDTSYYYAHKRKETNEEPAPPPVHVVLQVEAATKTQTIESIFNYQFMDDDKAVKIFIPLEGVGSVADGDITSTFTERSFEIMIRGYKPNKTLRLGFSKLYGEIVPEECRHKKLPNKVSITMKKKSNEDGKCSGWWKLVDTK